MIDAGNGSYEFDTGPELKYVTELVITSYLTDKYGSEECSEYINSQLESLNTKFSTAINRRY